MTWLRRLGSERSPSRSNPPLSENTLRLALARHDPAQARLQRLLDEVLPGLPVFDELVEERGRQDLAPATGVV